MDKKGWLLIFSTILGPIPAVQTQKWVELAGDRRNRKAWIFQALMATRANRTDVTHVQALNMIELGFYGRKLFGIHKRTKSEQAVLDAWKEYLDQLNSSFTNETLPIWLQNVMIYLLGFFIQFLLINEITNLRKFGIEVLEGKRAIKMDINSLPQPAHQQSQPAC